MLNAEIRLLMLNQFLAGRTAARSIIGSWRDAVVRLYL